MSEVKKAKRIVLGEGEVVGHKHILECESEIEFQEINDAIAFELKSIGILTHDEHARMVFPAGKYVSYNQVEYDPFNGSISRVYD
jgi:glutaminase